MKRSIILVLLFALSVCCHKQTTPVTAPENSCQFEMVIPEDGDYEVYNAAMSEVIYGQQTVVISDATYGEWLKDDHIKWLLEELPSLEQSTFDDLVEKNKERYCLGEYFSPEFNYILLSEAEEKEIFETGVLYRLFWSIVYYRDRAFKSPGWRKFYKKFPDSHHGIVGFSRVGFNSNKSQAIFLFEKVTGPLSGGGAFVLLNKEDGKWVVKKFFTAYI